MARYKDAELVMSVIAQYPRLNQTYKYDRAAGERGMSVPCNPADDGAKYELNIRMTKEQAVTLYKKMKAFYNERKQEDWKAFPPHVDKVTDDGHEIKGVFEIDGDGFYVASTNRKGSYNKDGVTQLVTPPAQYDSQNTLLPRDFMLTSGSEINVGLQFYAYHTGTHHGVTLRLMELQVVKLEPMKPREETAMASSFGKVDGGFKSEDGFATSFDKVDKPANDDGFDEDDDGAAPALAVVPDAPKPKPQPEAKAEPKKVETNDIDEALDNLEFDD